MDHSQGDPRKIIWDQLKETGFDGIQVFNNQLLLVTYKRPEKTASGIILTAKARDEDVYQGIVGLVVKKGPRAFMDDDTVKFYEQNVNVGDWVFYHIGDCRKMSLGKVDCRLIDDIYIKGTVSHPDDVY